VAVAELWVILTMIRLSAGKVKRLIQQWSTLPDVGKICQCTNVSRKCIQNKSPDDSNSDANVRALDFRDASSVIARDRDNLDPQQ